jgi:hypothetical protein
MDYLTQIYNYLNTGQNNIIIMTVYIVILLLAVILRVIACSAFRTSSFNLRLNSKDIRTREDIAKLRFQMLRTLAADYIRVSDKSVSRIPTAALVDRQLASMSLIGWRYVNIMNFVESIENGMLFVGLVLAVVFQEYVFLYGTLTVAGFLLTRLFTGFFNFRSAYSSLSSNLLIYLEREVGQFYSADTGGAVMRLRSELSDAIARQTSGLQEAIGKLSHSLADSVDKKLTGLNDVVNKSMGEWEKALTDASAVQVSVNEAAARMREAVTQLSSVSESLAKELAGNNESVTAKLTALTDTTAAFAAEQEAFLSQAKLIERNQHILESTYQSYELALQNLTQQLGEGLGAYLKMHAQTASQAVNEAMSANIEKIAQLIAIGRKQ